MGVAEDMESPQCMSCKHKDEGELICAAFPFGILEDILSNRILHDHVLDEQIGDYIYVGV